MQEPMSLRRADNCAPVSRNKVSVSVSALSSVPEARPASDSSSGVQRFDGRRAFIALSAAMVEVKRQIEQVAGVEAPVVLTGESGTGKEVTARLIHKLSGRGSQQFFKVNCAALGPELLECELFGCEAGAIAGVSEARAGKLEQANGGTLLLDAIEAVPVGVQSRLLQVLQDGEFCRVGSAAARKCDVRVIAAADSDLRQAVQNGSLRAELYYRLNVLSIHLPPLRERREDIPYLLNYFMANWSSSYGRPRLPITRRILDASFAYSWPGNVRELENVVRRYLVLGDEEIVVSQLESEPHQEMPPADSSIRLDLPGKDVCDLKSVVRDLKQDAEKAAILQALERTRGNKQEAASLLHISLRALHYKVRAYKIESASLRDSACVTFPEAAVRPQEPQSQPRATGAAKILTMERSGPAPVR